MRNERQGFGRERREGGFGQQRSQTGRGGRGNGGGGFRSQFSAEPREMHKATCTECGVECEVPFKPTQGKPVFCRECYRKRKPARF